MHILVTRPEPDSLACKVRLEARGHRVSIAPLTTIIPIQTPIPFAGAQALVATSRHALAALEAQPEAARVARALPLFAVGPATAGYAYRCGFTVVYEGPGDAQGLADTIAAAAVPQAGALLYLAGERVAFDMRAALAACGFEVRQQAIYKQVAAESFTPGAAAALARWEIDAAILMSVGASEIFVRLVQRTELASAARRLQYFCLSPAVARPLTTLTAARIEIAPRPTSEAILALVEAAAKPY